MTFPVVLFPVVTTAVKNHLEEALDDYNGEPYVDGVVVDTVTPKPVPAVFIFIERLGGVRTLLSVDQPRVDFTIWHQTDDEAHQLAQLARALVHQMPGIVGEIVVTRVVDVAGPFRSPDPAHNRPRYRFTVEIGVHNIDLPYAGS